MARNRLIKPEFWVDEKIVKLSAWARLLFIGLWNFADDEGRMIYSPERIGMQVFPRDKVEVDKLVRDELAARAGLVTIYSVGSKNYLQVRKFSEHQKVDKRVSSRHPAPPLDSERADPELGAGKKE